MDRSSVVEGIHRRLVEEGTGEEVHPSPAEAGIGLVVVGGEEGRHTGPGEGDTRLEGGSHLERTARSVDILVVRREGILGTEVAGEGSRDTPEEAGLRRGRLGEDIRREGVVGSTTCNKESLEVT